MTRELIVDSFAGGGGASTGIELALGRSPDIAINHDAEALAMHAINHPATRHLNSNIWRVDPHEATGGRPVGLAWFSPDCKHFSKAKGGRPVSRNIRDLAWVVVLWAKRVRPRVILLENVEEFRDWGPITAEGQPCKERKGQTFERWLGELRRLGYRVEWRELRACDYGAPTIRKRLFLIARRDGLPIVWPQPTHGAPDGADVVAGKRLPWRTAAEIIDWSLPCPSIFLTKEEGRAIGVNRPLVEATMARIAKGVKRYVLDAAKPFIVSVAHGYSGGRREYPIADPLGTVTGGGVSQALVAPHITKFRNGAVGHSLDEPLATVTANSHITKPGGAPPLGMAAVTLTKFSENSTGYQPDEPLHTVMAGAPRHGLVAAFLAQHSAGSHPGRPAHAVEEPVSTVTQSGSQQSVVSAGMVSLKGSDRSGRDVGEPLQTVCAGATHAAEVRAFLIKYYGADQDPRLEEPLHTVTSKDRFGVVTVNGEPYRIVDIGMRMLTPRELFRAQGFPDNYVTDRGLMPDGSELCLTKTAQIRMCGNSVCPPIAAALVRANYQPMAAAQPAVEDVVGPLFREVAA